MLDEYFSDCGDWRIDIIENAIKDEVLRKAKISQYDDYVIRKSPTALLKKYPTASDGHYEVSNIIQQRVTFSKLNLLDPS